MSISSTLTKQGRESAHYELISEIPVEYRRWLMEAIRLLKRRPWVFEYRLGNRSALDWIIDQYQVSTDKRSGITNDPNNLDDPQYIIRLIGKVVAVSLETMKIVKLLPSISQDSE